MFCAKTSATTRLNFGVDGEKCRPTNQPGRGTGENSLSSRGQGETKAKGNEGNHPLRECRRSKRLDHGRKGLKKVSGFEKGVRNRFYGMKTPIVVNNSRNRPRERNAGERHHDRNAGRIRCHGRTRRRVGRSVAWGRDDRRRRRRRLWPTLEVGRRWRRERRKWKADGKRSGNRETGHNKRTSRLESCSTGGWANAATGSGRPSVREVARSRDFATTRDSPSWGIRTGVRKGAQLVWSGRLPDESPSNRLGSYEEREIRRPGF